MAQEKAKPEAPLTDTQLQALLVLLGDEDSSISEPVRKRLISGDRQVRDWVRKHRLPDDPMIRRRVGAIIDEWDSDHADIDFLTFILAHGEQFDLEEAVWRFVRTRYPRESMEGWRALFDDYAAEVQESLPPDANGAVKLGAINRLLFVRLGLKGNETKYYEPENSYLNRVIERKLGIPLALCLPYLFIAKRLHLPVTGIGMPYHFLCRYQTSQEEYYVDCFRGGTLLSRMDCQKRLSTYGLAYDESHLHPISPRRIVQRMVANLLRVHEQKKDKDEVARLQRYVVALAR